jgi:hypothetical protein
MVQRYRVVGVDFAHWFTNHGSSVEHKMYRVYIKRMLPKETTTHTAALIWYTVACDELDAYNKAVKYWSNTDGYRQRRTETKEG